MDNGDRIDAIVIDISKTFDLVLHDRLLMKIAISGVNSRVIAWVREFLLGRMQVVNIEGQLSEEVRVTSGVPQSSVLGCLLFRSWLCNIYKVY